MMSASHHKSFPNKVSHPQLEDATERLRISVDLDLDVRGAQVMDVENCPGARCIRRTVPGVKRVWVKATVAIIEFEDGRVVRYGTAKRLRDAINGFDGMAGLFPPGDYEFLPVSPRRRMGVRKEYENASKNAADRKNPRRKRSHSYTFR